MDFGTLADGAGAQPAMDSGAAASDGAVGAQSAMSALGMLRRLMIDAGAGDLFDALSAAPPTRMTRRPATVDALSDVAGDDGQDCAICLDQGDATAAAGWKETPCRHRFHGGCLEKWLQASHTTCPLCRQEIPPPPAITEEEASAGVKASMSGVTFPNGRVTILFYETHGGGGGGADGVFDSFAGMDDETDDDEDIDDDVIEDSDDGGAEEEAAPIEEEEAAVGSINDDTDQ